ncbi:MAG: UDP-N-acetylglucosamine--N-acetylmuramyl-(pentapeptide) pyrophosphoryl-undecaprenol N-acetylglucosamine transferase [Thermosipho sp. (in: Bacteria)]|nr:UDP-N-acetylglucosamine--N-acetylmuramyl-(pentapeptide) pyrophosphoryl-undecaprenol N-acetylglucosamine transferase [Thermosipho sp. (in: thermotogales)]
MKLRIAVAGGVTGGHLYPALSVLEGLEKYFELDVLYFTVKGKLEERVLKNSSYNIFSLDIKGLKRPIYSFENIKTLVKVVTSKKKVTRKLKEFKPDLVFTTGGYVSYPVGVAAYKLKIPLFIHEQNVIPGLSNLKLSRYATKIFVSFEDSKKYFDANVIDKIVVTGNPVRIRNLEELSFEKPAILIVGGSGGSEFLNELACRLAREVKEYIFILSSGRKVVNCIENNLKVVPYIENMSDYYKAVSCAITRGGATTISELLYFEVPCIVIPWEGSTESHQIENARQVEKVNLGYMVREKDVKLEDIVKKINKLVEKKREVVNKKNPVENIIEEIIKEVKK